jgi:peptidoglycan/LPS O-acetylase OafA/YrhL
VTGLRESWGWHVAYISNVYFYQYGWHGALSHFWSLAVEEQFYFFWPLLMLFLPGRWLRPVILTAVLVAPFYAMAMNASILGNPTASVLMPSCLSALGMGAFIAWSARNGITMRPFKQWLLCLGLAGVVVWRGCGCPAAFNPLNRLAEDCVLGWLVLSAAAGFGGLAGAILAWSPMNYLGKISYGLYLFHNFAAPAGQGLMNWLNNPPWLVKIYDIPTCRVLLYVTGTIGLASLSWFCFEKPINNLKRKFPYPAGLKPSSP